MGRGLVFVTHCAEAGIVPRIEAIRRALGENDHLYVLVDKQNVSEDSAQFFSPFQFQEDVSVIEFTSQQLAKDLALKTFRPGNIYPGSLHFPVLWVFMTTFHSFYGQIEWDVLFSGDWAEFLGRFDEVNCDLLGTHVAKKPEAPDWSIWKKKIRGAWFSPRLDTKHLTKAFFPVLGASPRMLEKVLQAQRRGWMGHFEALLPTLASQNSYSIIDLAQSEEVKDVCGVLAPGTFHAAEYRPSPASFRYKPYVLREEVEAFGEGTLFHPVKDLNVGWTGDR